MAERVWWVCVCVCVCVCERERRGACVIGWQLLTHTYTQNTQNTHFKYNGPTTMLSNIWTQWQTDRILSHSYSNYIMKADTNGALSARVCARANACVRECVYVCAPPVIQHRSGDGCFLHKYFPCHRMLMNNTPYDVTSRSWLGKAVRLHGPGAGAIS